MSKSAWLLPLIAAALLASACGGGDSAGPSDANLAGSWTLSASNVSGQGVSCGLGNTPVTISQSGGTFTGTYGPGTITCVAGGQSSSGTTQGTIVNGTVDVNAVQFDLDTQDFHHTGTVSGNSMSGSVRWTIDVGGSIGVVVLNGNWSAARQ
jgi:hypothetical protein